MLEKEFYISGLISAQIKGELTVEQEIELNNWLAEKEAHRLFLEEFYDPSKFNLEIGRYLAKNKTSIWNKVTGSLVTQEVVPVKHQTRMLWIRLTVAASLLLVTGAAVYFLNGYSRSASEVLSPDTKEMKRSFNKATLTLASGRMIALNDHTGIIIGAEKLIYKDSTTIISGHEGLTVLPKNQTQLKINTPRGGQYEVLLMDHTHVWLNAASTLIFPSKFTGPNRKVTLNGEAYFEVSKDKRHPFVVTAGQQKVEVLGTHFNINSYPDEATVNTTLLEGSVRINDKLILKPNEQANLYKNGTIIVSGATENPVAWKDGNFVFEKENIESIMRKVARWYNVEIVYQGDRPTELYSGITKRSGNVQQILSILEETGTVKFKTEGNKIILSKNN